MTEVGGLGDRTDLSDEAVEAAARANYEYDRDVMEIRWERGTWEKLTDVERNWYIPPARRSLSAAAPLIRSREAERIANEIEAEGREWVQFLAGDTSEIGRGRLIGAEDAYKDAVRIAGRCGSVEGEKP